MPMLIFNTKSGTKEEFITQEPGVVKAYVCGPTVYDYCHVGHARAYVNFDVLKRYLEAIGYSFLHVQNFTDVDDKITKRAREREMDPIRLSDEYIEAYFRDMDALNVKRAIKYTRASDYIGKIISVTEKLLEGGHAYRAGGTIFFDVAGGGGFGELVSNIEESVSDPIEKGEKRGPFDFVLWREGQDGEMTWDGPLGRGRPGWHTECVAMAMENLGDVLDLHWGGVDLIFPHHECEALIAKALTGKTFVRYWMHNNFVLMSGKKMSKSIGKSVYIKDVLNKYPGEVLRTFILMKNYREQIEYSDEKMERAAGVYAGIKEGAAQARKLWPAQQVSSCVKEYADMLFGALDDNLETGQALAAVERLSWEIKDKAASKDFSGAARVYDAVESILGIRL